ncbi:MAG: DNA translocase FtsK [Acidobacteriota bacterium]|nr:DNA translocase FtsK [Acidobacteriota bacterium]
MAMTQTDTRTKPLAPRNTRLNEIVAIALGALGVLLALCLVSYSPNDPSWNSSASAADARNWAGVIGANVAVTLLQFVGLAAYLLPLLLLAAAWRRFRTRRIHAPLARVAGLVILLLAVSALLALFDFSPIFDGSVEPGGLAGTILAQIVVGGLNKAGASVLLCALAATGLLLATNFSFVRAYERLVEAFGDPRTLYGALSARYHTWRERRRLFALARAEQRREARAAHEKARAEKKNQQKELTPAERVEQFMRETAPAAGQKSSVPSSAIKRAAGIAGEDSAAHMILRGESERDFSELPAMPPAARDHEQAAAISGANGGAQTTTSKRTTEHRAVQAAGRTAEIEEMLEDVAVVRVEPLEDVSMTPEIGRDLKAERAARRAEKIAAALSNYQLPEVEFLHTAPPRHEQADEELRLLATRVAEKCKEFNVTGKIEYICPGPVVTTYEFKPDPGVKYARVTGLVDDLCLALKAESIRIDRVPGKAHVGIEVPNGERDNIMLREVIESRGYQESPSKLTLALGKTIDGLNYVADLARMPHLLIAGATGTGKSVCLNSLVVSILYKARPDEVKFIMIDPKRLELGLYADIPHLATPIITDPKRAANSLKWAVGQMEARYKELAKWGVRNIDGFNQEVLRRNLVEDFDEAGQPLKPLPYIVIIIDELADLMMVSGHEVEDSITRLAQMARAVGIHLVLATQRPSVDVITGLIKANFPSRIAFRVSSKVDSRTILDSNGAEQLLGRGDMLFLPPGTSRLVRVHGAYLDEAEINRIVAHIKAQGEPLYDETITQTEDEAANGEGGGGERDELFDQALRICVEMKRASTSVLQRRLRIGYGRAAAILDVMEREGYIGQADGARPRPVLGRAFETLAHWEEIENDE